MIESIRKFWKKKKKKKAGQNVGISKSYTSYVHHSWVFPIVNNTFIHDSNILKNSVNSPAHFIKSILSNEQHESITKLRLNKTKLEKTKSHILDLDGLVKNTKIIQ